MVLCVYYTGIIWFLHGREEAGGTGTTGKVSEGLRGDE